MVVILTEENSLTKRSGRRRSKRAQLKLLSSQGGCARPRALPSEGQHQRLQTEGERDFTRVVHIIKQVNKHTATVILPRGDHCLHLSYSLLSYNYDYCLKMPNIYHLKCPHTGKKAGNRHCQEEAQMLDLGVKNFKAVSLQKGPLNKRKSCLKTSRKIR